jgi:adenylate kinase family enzyme
MDVQLISLREVLDHYRRTGILRSVDGLRPIDAVAQDVSAVASAAGPKEQA